MKKKLFSEIPYIEGRRITLRQLTISDAPVLAELKNSRNVYRYLPTFLFEQKYDDARYVIEHLYDECWKESIILGIYKNRGSQTDNEIRMDTEARMDTENQMDTEARMDTENQMDTKARMNIGTSMDAGLQMIGGNRRDDIFCGLAEMYGFRDPIHKISVGYRLLEKFWGQGIATEALGLMIDYLFQETDIEIITASTMIENQASAHVLSGSYRRCGCVCCRKWGCRYFAERKSYCFYKLRFLRLVEILFQNSRILTKPEF